MVLVICIIAAHVKSVGCLRESNIAEKNQLPKKKTLNFSIV